MSRSQYDIFISYRRDGGADKARILKAELEKRGYMDRVFLDYDELKDGKFDKRIMKAIEDAPVFIFILTPGSLDRCVNDDDWVRQEILYAVKTERHIVPVNFDKLFTEFPENIPSNVKNALGQHQFSQVDSETLLRVSVDQLVRDRIEPVLKNVLPSSKEPEEGAIYHIYTDCDCVIERFGEKIGNAYIDSDNHICLKRGRHKLKFISLQNPVDFVEMVIEVETTEFEDFRDIRLSAVVKAREEAECKACEEAEREAREEAERKAYEEAERKACEEAERKAHKEAERKARKEAERKAREEWLLAQDDNSFKSIKENNNWSCIDKNGESITPFKYDNIYLFSEGLACVELNEKFGFIDKTGKEVIPLIYDYAGSFSDEVAEVKLNGKYGFIDKTGKKTVPLEYDDAWEFCEGFAAVKSKGKWGYINQTGKVIIPLEYDEAGDFSDGVATVLLNGKYYEINQFNEKID